MEEQHQGHALDLHLVKPRLYGNCSFCSIASFYRLFPGRTWRAREAEQVVDEIEYCVKGLKNKYVFFVDDNFVGPGKTGRHRAYAIAKEIMNRKLRLSYYVACRTDNVDRDLFAALKESGLDTVLLGVESGNQHALDVFNKGTTVEQNRKAIDILCRRRLNTVHNTPLENWTRSSA